MGGLEPENCKEARGRTMTKIKPICSDDNDDRFQPGTNQWNYQDHIKNRILEFYKNDVPDRNKSFKLRDKGIQII